MKFLKKIFGSSLSSTEDTSAPSAITDFGVRTLKVLSEKYGDFVCHTILLNDTDTAQQFFANLSFFEVDTGSTPENIQVAMSANQDGKDVIVIIGGQLTSDEHYEILKRCIEEGLERTSMTLAAKSSLPHREFQKAVQFIKLVEELIDIGRSTFKTEDGISFFWGDDGDKNKRVVEIGNILYEMGGNRITLMQEAAQTAVSSLEGGEMDLSAHWHMIGEKEWQQKTGECWMA